MSNFLAEPLTIFAIKPKRSIGGITGHTTLNETATDKLTVTKHPVQQGASISDHAYKEPTDLNVSIITGSNLKPLDEIYEDFLKLQSDRVKFNIVTGKRSYTNMLLISISNTTDKLSENILSLNLVFVEIITVEVTSTKVPPRKNQSNPGKTGATEKGGKKSALKIGVDAITKLFGG